MLALQLVGVVQDELNENDDLATAATEATATVTAPGRALAMAYATVALLVTLLARVRALATMVAFGS